LGFAAYRPIGRAPGCETPAVAAKVVTAPDGRRWTVRRRWLHRPPRFRRLRLRRPRTRRARDAGPNWLDALELPVEGAVSDARAALVLAGIAVAALLLWFFVLPALVLLVDVLFRRPWDVVAETRDEPAQRVDIPVVGFCAAGAKVDEVATNLAIAGRPVPR
jgi:hypothetical protein